MQVWFEERGLLHFVEQKAYVNVVNVGYYIKLVEDYLDLLGDDIAL